MPRKEESALAQFLQTQPRPPAECDRPPARTRVIAMPRTQPSWRGPADDCMARMMRKSNRARSISDAALLLLQDIWLLVRHVPDHADEVDGTIASASPGLDARAPLRR
jgi:hypothetical protein